MELKTRAALTANPASPMSEAKITEGLRSAGHLVLLISVASIFLIPWFFAVAILMRSTLFSMREKVLSLLLLPGGLFTAIITLASSSSTSCAFSSLR